jgi:hypothetical protein
MKFVWRTVSSDLHVATLNDIHVARVSRPGPRSVWRIDVLGTRDFDRTFKHYDPTDLESTKSGAEARTKWAIECLYKSLQEPSP